jgi:ethanolamine permease
VASHFHYANISHTGYDNYQLSSIIKAMPFAIWMYLGIEGVSLVTKNIQAANFRRTISRGYLYGFWTLVVLVAVVLLLAGGGLQWTKDTWELMVSDNNSHPLPLSLQLILTKGNALVQIFTFLGLFGLIASLQGITMASMNQVQAIINEVKPGDSRGRALISSLVVLVIGGVSIWREKTNILIELSVFGAVCLYFFSCLSLVLLRRAQPEETAMPAGAMPAAYTHSQFNGWRSGLFAAIAILISFCCMNSLVLNHPMYFAFFVALAVVYLLMQYILGRRAVVEGVESIE